MTSTFKYIDITNKLFAKAQEEFLTWGVKIDVTDENGKLIGYIEEEIFESMISLENTLLKYTTQIF
jgi:hypothetical protein